MTYCLNTYKALQVYVAGLLLHQPINGALPIPAHHFLLTSLSLSVTGCQTHPIVNHCLLFSFALALATL